MSTQFQSSQSTTTLATAETNFFGVTWGPLLIMPILWGLLSLLMPTKLVAVQTIDTVILRGDSGTTTSRKGTIIQWRGDTLTLSTDNRDKQIDNAVIAEIQTNWPAEYGLGLAALKSGDFMTAMQQLQTAVDNENRPWAERTIRADLVRAASASEKHDAAIEHFLRMIADDPQTRFFHLIPVQWVSTNHVPIETANRLMDSRDPVERLISASWLLASREREAATQTLDQLSRDIDPRIQHLAIAQLWRLRGLNLSAINLKQIDVWNKQIVAMPAPLRAGPWFVIADAQARLEQIDDAATNWMRIPILYPEQCGLSAAALYHSAHLLHNTGRDDESQSIRNELQQKFPQSVWAKLEN